MTDKEEDAIKELVEIYYVLYKKVLSKRYIETYVLLGSSLFDNIEEYEEYLERIFNKEYKLRRSTKLLIHLGHR